MKKGILNGDAKNWDLPPQGDQSVSLQYCLAFPHKLILVFLLASVSVVFNIYVICLYISYLNDLNISIVHSLNTLGTLGWQK